MGDAASLRSLTASLPVPRRGAWRKILHNPVGLVTTGLLVAILAVGILAPLLAPFDPNLARLELTNAPPFSSDFLLGGDQAGRDILSRLMYATAGTAKAVIVALLVSAVAGVSAGLVAGYFGGRLDEISNWVSNVVMALPGFVLLIALHTVIGPNILLAMAIFGFLMAPSFFRLVRSLAKAVRREDYVDAARVSGLSDGRIVSRHVLRVVQGPIIVHAAFILVAGISVQAGLEFLGLGDRRRPSWGGMLQDAFGNIYNNGVAVIWPALSIGLTTMSLILLANVIRDVLQIPGHRHRPSKLAVIRQSTSDETIKVRRLADPPLREPPLLRIKDLALGYADSATSVRAVVHGINLVVERGEIHGLVGESGSGKSQVAYSILGILPPEAVLLCGSIEFHGREILARRAALRDVRGRRIAYVPQEPMTNLDPTFSIGQQLSYGLRAVTEISRRKARELLIDLLGRVGVRDPRTVFDLYPHQISGGMAQRVLIAGAIAADPELIVADEPTTALDVTVQADVLDLLRDLQRERNLGMVLVTHNFGVVADICDRVSVMKEGRIVESKPALDMFCSPEHEYTKMLLASTLEQSQLRTPLSWSGPER